EWSMRCGRRSTTCTASTVATSCPGSRPSICFRGTEMDFNKLTLKSQEAVAAAQELARRMGNPELYPEHLLLALLDQDLPQQLVPDAAALRAQAEAGLRGKPSIQGAQQQPNVSAAFARVLDQAADEAKRMEDDYVSTEHLLLALDVVPRDQLLAKIQQV